MIAEKFHVCNSVKCPLHVPGGRRLPVRCKSKDVQRNMVVFTFSISAPRTFVDYCSSSIPGNHTFSCNKAFLVDTPW